MSKKKNWEMKISQFFFISTKNWTIWHKVLDKVSKMDYNEYVS